MATEFNTQVGNGKYCLQFETDNEAHYLLMQSAARRCVDCVHMTNADRIRSMTDEELALWICGVYDIEEENGKFINGIIIPGYAPHDIEEWLQQPAEETDNAHT